MKASIKEGLFEGGIMATALIGIFMIGWGMGYQTGHDRGYLEAKVEMLEKITP